MAEEEKIEHDAPAPDAEPVSEVADATPEDASAAEAEAPDEAVAEATPVDEPVGVEADQTGAADAAPDAAEEEAPEAEAAPAPTAKRKKKRLPRAQRPPRTKPKRQTASERKPIVRLPKPEHVRGRRQERQGTVVSSAADKTIVVRVDVVKVHPRYKKVIRRSAKFHAHDESNQANVGDVVRIVETRPLSKTKRWRLVEIVEAAK